MYAINHVTSTPVLRPLLTLDKEDIIKKAKEIGTFETSIQPLKIAVQSLHRRIQ